MTRIAGQTSLVALHRAAWLWHKELPSLLAQAFFGGHMKHHLVTAAILIAALALYSLGMVSGALVLFAVGGACELWFWVRILGRNERPDPSSKRMREKPRAA
jgi:membrane protein implicated in regulation of membrane protease activity